MTLLLQALINGVMAGTLIAVPARSRTEIATATAKQPPTLDLSWEKREARMLGDGIAYLRPGPTYNVEGGEALM